MSDDYSDETLIESIASTTLTIEVFAELRRLYGLMENSVQGQTQLYRLLKEMSDRQTESLEVKRDQAQIERVLKEMKNRQNELTLRQVELSRRQSELSRRLDELGRRQNDIVEILKRITARLGD